MLLYEDILQEISKESTLILMAIGWHCVLECLNTLSSANLFFFQNKIFGEMLNKFLRVSKKFGASFSTLADGEASAVVFAGQVRLDMQLRGSINYLLLLIGHPKSWNGQRISWTWMEQKIPGLMWWGAIDACKMSCCE